MVCSSIYEQNKIYEQRNMENNIKEIAKRNFLTLEANHKYVKRLANMSSNDKNYTYHKRAEAQELLCGYISHTEQFTNKDILDLIIQIMMKYVL